VIHASGTLALPLAFLIYLWMVSRCHMIDTIQLNLLPGEPGVYIMKNARQEVVYVGKAIDIQKRVRSHCRRQHGRYASPFVELVETVETVITDSDVEALLLEYNLIKKHNPPFNVKLKDDKRYPYIKLTMQEDFPRAYLTRTVDADGARYFGPYPHVTQARRTLAALHEILPIRTCKYDSQDLLGVRPCLEYEMGRCCAPCGQIVSKEEYALLCQGIIEFLQGHSETVIKRLQDRMRDCAEVLLFEKAAFYRDILEAAQQFAHRQKMMRQTVENQDFVGYGRIHDIACTAVIRRRGGRVVGASRHFLADVSHADIQEILNAFLEQFYPQNIDIPKEIYLSATVGSERLRILEKWLSLIAGKSVTIKIPQRGMKHAMLQLAEKNAAHYAEQHYRKLHGVKRNVSKEVITLQESLKLEILPLRIEGYDISNTQGDEAVGSMVVFQDGKPFKSGYRRFRIRGVDQINDFAMIQEVLRRRFLHGAEEEAEKQKFAESPDLLLIDGGKGQLNAALEVLDELEIRHFPICSLAKREEEIYLPGLATPIRLDRRNAGLRLLQQVRDESHRFGIAYHRKLRGQKFKKSLLRDIPGIGPAKERALLQRFGSLEGLRAASVEEMTSLPGIKAELAGQILQTIKKRNE